MLSQFYLYQNSKLKQNYSDYLKYIRYLYDHDTKRNPSSDTERGVHHCLMFNFTLFLSYDGHVLLNVNRSRLTQMSQVKTKMDRQTFLYMQMLISYRYALYFIQDTDFYREVLPLFKHNLIENYLRLKHLKIENCTLSLETRSSCFGSTL